MFLNSVFSYAQQFNPTRIIATWDKKLTYPSTNFRKEALKDLYKSNRDRSSNEDAHKYDDHIINLLIALGITNIYPNKLEADDVIAWITHNIPGKKCVVSVDKDLLQLIKDDTVVYSPIKKVLVDVNNFEVHADGVGLKYFKTYKALVGDNSDNIPGIPKVGPKRGLKMAQQIVDTGNIECLNEEHKEIYRRNLSLIDLSSGYLYEDEYKVYENQWNSPVLKPNYQQFVSICKELELNQILNNKDKWYPKFFMVNKLNSLIESLKI